MGEPTVCIRCGDFASTGGLVLPGVPLCRECAERASGRTVSPLLFLLSARVISLVPFMLLGGVALVLWMRAHDLAAVIVYAMAGAFAAAVPAALVIRLVLGRAREDAGKDVVLARLGFPETARGAVLFALLRNEHTPKVVHPGLLVPGEGGFVFLGLESPLVVAREAVFAARLLEPSLLAGGPLPGEIEVRASGPSAPFALQLVICEGRDGTEARQVAEALAARLSEPRTQPRRAEPE